MGSRLRLSRPYGRRRRNLMARPRFFRGRTGPYGPVLPLPRAIAAPENAGARSGVFWSRAVETRTSVTLLARLRQIPADQAAWAEFTERYGRKIYAWCRRWNLQEADAEDVTQIVLLKLAEKMQRFEYDREKS